jgi:hypothetical protein
VIRNRVRIVNNVGYLLVWQPTHDRADKSGAYEGYVYEHILVAERALGRPLKRTEHVHHLDLNKVNNAPSNLLVLSRASHAKLHGWLDSIGYFSEHRIYSYRHNGCIDKVLAKCTRCKVCQMPTDNSSYCGSVCQSSHRECFIAGSTQKKPSKANLMKRLSRQSWVAVGEHYGVSDNAVRKWAIAYGINPFDYFRGRKV